MVRVFLVKYPSTGVNWTYWTSICGPLNSILTHLWSTLPIPQTNPEIPAIPELYFEVSIFFYFVHPRKIQIFKIYIFNIVVYHTCFILLSNINGNCLFRKFNIQQRLHFPNSILHSNFKSPQTYSKQHSKRTVWYIFWYGWWIISK